MFAAGSHGWETTPMRSLALAAILALAFTSPAMAKSQCKDAHGKFTSCSSASSTKSDKSGYNMKASKGGGGAPHCTTGKPCGNSCIAKDKVCHK
jgi:hypothetical protein